MVFARERDLERLVVRKRDGLIKVITGIRRVGKSYLLMNLFYGHLLSAGVKPDQIIRFAFDSMDDLGKLGLKSRYRNGRPAKVEARRFMDWLSPFIQGGQPYYLLLDEIQELDSFESVLNSYLRRGNIDIYVTGSNSRFLSGDVLTEFRGRGEEIHILPLTYREYVEGTGLPADLAWREYVQTGGIPLVAQMRDDEQKETYLQELCREVYLTDIIERNAVQFPGDLGELLDTVASMMASVTNPTRITNTFNAEKHRKLTDDTIHRYLGFFEEAFLINRVRRFDIEGRRYINGSYKFYFEDVGIRNARLNFRQINETHIMENIIYNELRHRGYRVDTGNVEIREKTDRTDKNRRSIYTTKQLEVDFVATRGSDKVYIQSAFSTADEQKEAQEKRSLFHIGDSFQKVILVGDNIKAKRDEAGIATINVRDFLLGAGGI